MSGCGLRKPKDFDRRDRGGKAAENAETRLSGQGFRSIGKPICEPLVTLVASGLPTFCALLLAKSPGFA